MIEIEIPKDISKYEAKLVGAFTARQVGCLVAAGALAIPTFLALKDSIPRDLASIIVLIIVTPFVLLGWVKIYGMTFEQFVKTAFISNVLSPKKRKYVTMNAYDYLEDPDFGEEKMQKDRKVLNGKEMRKEMETKLKTDVKYYV